MNVFCIVMFKFNYSVGDIKNSDLGEGIVCLGVGSCGKGGGKCGKGGREVGEKGEGSGGKGGVGNAYPSVHPLHINQSRAVPNFSVRFSEMSTCEITYG